MNTAIMLNFLRQLQQNNEKAWMDAHRDQYETAKEEFKSLVTYLLSEMASVDESLVGLQPKDCIFRINRDVRFSQDKSPYKNNFGAYLSEGGKKGEQAGYYLHLQPYGESFIGGGMYMPSPDTLHKVRQEIDYNASELKKIVDIPDFQKYFGEIQGGKLKRPPKGYKEDHPNIELLKLKDYLVLHRLTDAEVASEDFPQQTVKMFKVMMPFVHYLNVAIS